MTLMLAPLLLQDASAEETLKKLEEKIEKAKTISFKFRCEVTAPNKEGARIESSG